MMIHSFECDKLFLLGLEITEQRKNTEMTDNTYLLLGAEVGGNTTTIPSLARVEGVYRVVMAG